MLDKLKNILNKKIPFRVAQDDLTYRKLNHIIQCNAPQDWIGRFFFDYVETKCINEEYHEYYHNKWFNMMLDLKVQYVQCIAEPKRGYFLVSSYKLC